ncbi:hypothetical protein CPB83DRAFT_422160 [Crepidotus variabilis]|uniref:MYND-type domain-containing protein n=1 Tax=Crepidotus variabilis TaxID=179855 RepID=A0A9P6ERH2_9AGAR|nr:hypothetical protein CPB83DRAFT_422160 [Crepidotus variabilis]
MGPPFRQTNIIDGVYGISEQYIKKTSANLACTICGHQSKAIKICPCRTAGYCSKDCQKLHWRTHKASCIEAAVAHDMSDYLMYFLMNNTLITLLRIALIEKGGLLDDPQPNSCHEVAVTVTVMPVTDEETHELAYGRVDVNDDTHEIPGCLTFSMPTARPFTSIPVKRPILKHHPSETQIMMVWKEAKYQATKLGRSKNPVVVVLFSYKHHQLCHAIEITPDAFEAAQKFRQPKLDVSSALMAHNKPEERPKAWLESILMVINDFVRDDYEDKLKMRLKMAKYDKEFIRNIFTTRLEREKAAGAMTSKQS